MSDINSLNPNCPEERELGIWFFTLTTAHANNRKILRGTSGVHG